MVIAGCVLLAASIALIPAAHADTIVFKNKNQLKGLVVEKHADRVIISTEEGELPVLLKDIARIEYDDQAQNLFEIGKAREAEGKIGEALAYFEKAHEVNPNLEEAERAALAVKNRFWSANTEKPLSEVERQQALHDAWGSGKPIEEVARRLAAENQRSLKAGIGVQLEKKGDWVRLAQVDPKKDAALVGMKKNDRLVSIDGDSLRFFGVDQVSRKMLEPRLTNYTLEFERDCFVRFPEEGGRSLKTLGLKLKLEYKGLVVHSIPEDGAAATAGLREGDVVVRIDEESTRYLPLKKAVELIEGSAEDRVILTVRRTALLMRK